MRIVYVVDRFPGLSETFVLNQITGLMDRGHEVRIVARRPSPDPVHHPDVDRYGLMERVVFLDPGSIVDRVVRFPGMLATGLARRPSATLRSLSPGWGGRQALSLRWLHRLRRTLDLGRVDVVHAHYGRNGVLAVRLRELGVLNAPVAVTFHGYDLRDGMERGGQVFRPLQEEAERVFAISRWSRDVLEDLGFSRDRMIFHPVGIDPGRFGVADDMGAETTGDGSDHRSVRILMVGRLSREKGQDVGIRAFHRLESLLSESEAESETEGGGRGLSLEIVGDGPLRSELEALAASLGLTDRVVFAGALEGPAVARRYGAADLYLLPSRHEVTPMVLLEAQAAGLPVVATDVGAVREIVVPGESALLSDSEDIEGLAESLRVLVADSGRWNAMGRAGRRFVEENHDVHSLNDRLEIHLRELAGGRKTPRG